MTAAFIPAGFDAILMGDESLTIACGDMLLTGGHRLPAVVTRDPAVRGWAEGKGLKVLENPRDLIAAGVTADWLLSIANLRMIRRMCWPCLARGRSTFTTDRCRVTLV